MFEKNTSGDLIKYLEVIFSFMQNLKYFLRYLRIPKYYKLKNLF